MILFSKDITIEEKFSQYIKYGGMPGIITLKNDIKNKNNRFFIKFVI